MGSEGLLTAPDAVVLAAGASPVLSAPAALVLAVHAARASADDGAGAPTSVLGWQTAAEEVCGLNARIRMLAERAERAGVRTDPLDQLCLKGRTVTEAVGWLEAAEAQLRSTHAALGAAVAADEARRVLARLPSLIADRPETGGAVTGLQRVLNDRHIDPADRSPGPVTGAGSALLNLDADANERERAEVLLMAASLVPSETDQTDQADRADRADAAVRALTTGIAAVNAAVARRRLAARYLSALEEPMVQLVEPPGPLLGTAAKLRTVVVGDEDLTPHLSAEGAEAVAWAAEIARRRFVCDVIRGCLTDRGYTVVDEGPDPRYSGELRLTRPDWHGEHSAEVWVDRHGAVHGRVLCEHGTDKDSRRDRARRADFNEDVVALGRRLDADVVIDEGFVPRPPGRAQDSTIAATAPPPERDSDR